MGRYENNYFLRTSCQYFCVGSKYDIEVQEKDYKITHLVALNGGRPGEHSKLLLDEETELPPNFFEKRTPDRKNIEEATGKQWKEIKEK